MTLARNPAHAHLPGFRSGDPSTSKKGAFDALPRTGSQRMNALQVVWRHRVRGVTYEDVIQATGNTGVWKRLSELKQGGWIKAKGQRKVSTGSMADVYFPTEKTRMWRNG